MWESGGAIQYHKFPGSPSTTMTILVANTIATLLSFIRSSDFEPSEIPDLCLAFWTSVLQSNPLVDQKKKSQLTPLEVYTKSQPLSFFNLADQPHLAKFAKEVVLSHLVLGAVFEKIDIRLMDGVTTVKEGFYAFVGAYWNRAFQDDEITIVWILKLLWPLLQRTQLSVTRHNSETPNQFRGSKILEKNPIGDINPKLPPQSEIDTFTAGYFDVDGVLIVTLFSDLINPLLAPVGFVPVFSAYPMLLLPSLPQSFTRLAQELFWPDTNLELGVMEEELMYLENARYSRTQEDEFSLLPAFEMSKVSAIEEKPFPNPNVDSLHNDDPSDIEVDDIFLTVDMINTESSPSARRPLTPRNTVEVPRSKGKGKDNADS
ncbi:hypothetical protein C8R46DRAFT_1028295 [Mycena filopes]|nr:hypothetical protein C8R46DRAFT_1028295 [Mycena filopes]